MARIRLLLADDQELFVNGLRRIVEMTADDIEVVGVAATGQEAVDLADEKTPDVVLMDVRMPELDGVAATKEIRQRHPETHIIMLTTFDDDEYVHDAIEYGARGYLLKDIPPDDLIKAVRSVGDVPVLISPSVLERLFSGPPTADTPAEPEPRSPARAAEGRALPGAVRKALTPREQQVLELIMRNFDNTEIANTLSIAERTVRNYVSLIYDKLMVESRFELIRYVQDSREEDT
jgi:DNA-binding NarL/FixJ family response regulator